MNYPTKTEIEKFTNERLVEELVDISGGDDYNGILSKNAKIYQKDLLKELYKRLNINA